MIARLLRRALLHPLARDLDLDSAEATAVHHEMIARKPFLQKLYLSFYGELAAAARRAPDGLRVEIGAGAGFMEQVLPGVKTLDVRPGAQVDVVASALDLPFGDGSIACLFMLDVLHHLPDLERFFAETRRVLMPGGRLVMIEPFNSWLGKLVYQRLHHEPFVPEVAEWRLDNRGSGGPMTDSNQALPWIVFERDRARFEREYPELRIAQVRRHTMALYLLSGGLSMRGLVPSPLFEPLRRVEAAALPLLGPTFATMATIEVERV